MNSLVKSANCRFDEFGLQFIKVAVYMYTNNANSRIPFAAKDFAAFLGPACRSMQKSNERHVFKEQCMEQFIAYTAPLSQLLTHIYMHIII